MRLEEERRRAEQEAARLEAERMEAIIAKEELERQAEDQIRSSEQLVSAAVSTHKDTDSTTPHVSSLFFSFSWDFGSVWENSREILLYQGKLFLTYLHAEFLPKSVGFGVFTKKLHIAQPGQTKKHQSPFFFQLMFTKV